MIAELPMLDRPIEVHLDHLSYSAIKTFQTCPRQFLFRYILHLPDELVGSSLVFGTSLHRAVEAHFRCLMEDEKLPDLDTLLGVFWDAWQAEAKPIKFNKNEDLSVIGSLADRMLRVFQTSDFARPEGRIIGIEETLRGAFAPDCPDFVARVDLLIETDDVLTVTDFKTSRSKWNPAKVNDAKSQLLVYSDLSEDMADGRPVQLNFAVLTKGKKPDLTQHPVLWDDDQVEQTRQTVVEIWEAIQNGVVFPNPSFAHCPRCPYQSACQNWRG